MEAGREGLPAATTPAWRLSGVCWAYWKDNELLVNPQVSFALVCLWARPLLQASGLLCEIRIAVLRVSPGLGRQNHLWVENTKGGAWPRKASGISSWSLFLRGGPPLQL